MGVCVLRSVTNQRRCWPTDCYSKIFSIYSDRINPLNAELNPICHLPVLLAARHILHISRMRVKDRNTVRPIKRRKPKLIGHISYRNCLLEHVIGGNI